MGKLIRTHTLIEQPTDIVEAHSLKTDSPEILAQSIDTLFEHCRITNLVTSFAQDTSSIDSLVENLTDIVVSDSDFATIN